MIFFLHFPILLSFDDVLIVMFLAHHFVLHYLGKIFEELGWKSDKLG
jgi:hypothetical protein